jgi:uncharacterized membrane protein
VTADMRLDALEDRVRALEGRLERDPAPEAPAPRPVLAVSRPAAKAPAMPARRETPSLRPTFTAPSRTEKPRRSTNPERQTFEDLVGGRVLAWLGGGAIVLGIAFLFALAISRGWIDEAGRTLLAGLASAGMLSLGIWLHERRARTDAALAATAAGIAGLFVSLTVAGQVYDLLPLPVTLAGALGIGAAGTGLALRWDSRGIAGLGLVGALLAPVLAGASEQSSSLALVFVALACSTAVVIHRRWGWLSLVSFLVATPQWAYWLSTEPPLTLQLLALSGFAALGMAAAVGYELRQAKRELRISSAFLLGLNASVAGCAGWFALSSSGHATSGEVFLAALAAAHLAAGLRRGSFERISDDLALLSLSIGVILANVVAALVLDGLILTTVLATSGVGFALLARHVHGGRQEAAVALGLGGHLALATLHAVAATPPDALTSDSGISAGGVAALAVVAAGCLVSGRIAGSGRPEWRVALDATGLAAVAYLTAASLDGSALAVAWATEAALLARIAAGDRDDLAAGASLCFAAGAALQALVIVAPPEALLYGLADPVAATTAVGAVALALAVQARGLAAFDERASRVLGSASAAAALYLASALIVTPFQPSGDLQPTLLDLDVRQQGQAVLSAFWSLTGLGTLVAGLVRDDRTLRSAGLSILLLAVGKVFMFDLATLDSVYRVASFVGLGVLLLLAAFVWQRIRPRTLPDLREAPHGVR